VEVDSAAAAGVGEEELAARVTAVTTVSGKIEPEATCLAHSVSSAGY